MNCFAHALPHLDRPYFAVGSCLPDWLTACDRKCRAREKNAVKWIQHQDPIVAAVAQGVVQHHRDDDWFHRTSIFNQLILNFAVELRDLFGNERTMRPSLVGHIAVEVLLDAYLNRQHPGKMELFYQQVNSVQPEQIQAAVNRFTTRATDKLVAEIRRFVRVKYLYDYDTDQGVVFRISKVLQRIKLAPLDGPIMKWMPTARERVYHHAQELLPQSVIAFG